MTLPKREIYVVRMTTKYHDLHPFDNMPRRRRQPRRLRQLSLDLTEPV